MIINENENLYIYKLNIFLIFKFGCKIKICLFESLIYFDHKF